MEAVFLKLLNMSITAGFLVPAVILLRLLLKRAPKWLHCALWVLVAIRLVLPISLESTVSLLPSAEPVPEDILWADPAPYTDSVHADFAETADPLPTDNAVILPAEKPPLHPVQTVLGAAAVLWLIGIAGMLCYMGASYLRIRKKTREAVPLYGNVLLCDRIESPFILGVLRPRIYLPADMGEADTQYVLAHERAHLGRLDHLWKPLGFLLLALHWFNPLLWIAYVLLCRDIEYACDEKVIAQMGTGVKKPYSDALIRASVPRRVIAACPLAFGEVNVEHRVKSVLHYKKPAFWIIILAVIAVLGLAAGFLTNPSTLRLEEHAWGFSHVQAGDEILYCAPSQSGQYPAAQPLSLTVEAKDNGLLLLGSAAEESWFFAYAPTDRSAKNVVYKLTGANNTGYAVLNRTKHYNGDMVGQMLTVQSEDGGLNAVFSLPNREERTLILSFDGYTVYFSDQLKTEPEMPDASPDTPESEEENPAPIIAWDTVVPSVARQPGTKPNAVVEYALEQVSLAVEEYDEQWEEKALSRTYRVYAARLTELNLQAELASKKGTLYVYAMEYKLLPKDTEITLAAWWDDYAWSTRTGPYLVLFLDNTAEEPQWIRLGAFTKSEIKAYRSEESPVENMYLTAAVSLYKGWLAESGQADTAVCGSTSASADHDYWQHSADRIHEFVCLRCADTTPLSLELCAEIGRAYESAKPENGVHRVLTYCVRCLHVTHFDEAYPCAIAKGEDTCVYCVP